MHYGVSLPNNRGVASVRALTDLAAYAEASGYESVWVSEHLMHATYVAERLGDRPYHEALTVLTAAAMTTSQVLLGTSVLVLPWHHPARLAKTLATLDVLSEGRVVCGIGVGVTEDEYAALGVPFKERGRIADEMLDAMKALWTQDVPAHRGAYYAFEGLRFEPKPFTKPHPPIWVGGNSAAALRRVARHGDGWHPLSRSPNELHAMRSALADTLDAAGRTDDKAMPLAVRLTVEFMDEPWARPVEERRTARGTVDELRALMAAYETAGVTHIIVDAASGDVGHVRALWDRFRTDVVAG